MPEILGTAEGIEALVNFVRSSGAFTRAGLIWKPPDPPVFDDEPYSEETDGEGQRLRENLRDAE